MESKELLNGTPVRTSPITLENSSASGPDPLDETLSKTESGVSPAESARVIISITPGKSDSIRFRCFETFRSRDFSKKRKTERAL
jgi:hypothetical protein